MLCFVYLIVISKGSKDMFVLEIFKHNFEFRKISVLSILCNVQAEYELAFRFLEPWFHKDERRNLYFSFQLQIRDSNSMV